MAEEKDLTFKDVKCVQLVELLEARWNGLYEDIVATHKHLKEAAVPVEVEGVPHWNIPEKEHAKFVQELSEFITMSDIMMQWGTALKKADQVIWTKRVFASMVGLKDDKELDKMIKENVKKFAKA